MALASLAALADLPAAWAVHGDAQRALDVASSAIRDAADAMIGPTQTSTVTIRRPGREPILRLPGPIIAVSSVAIDGNAVTDYILDDAGLYRCSGWAGDVVVIAYTHGLAAVPDDIADMCSQMAVAWLEHREAGGGLAAGVQSVRIDDGAESYTDERAGQVSPVYIPDVTRKWLRARFGGGLTVVKTE